VNYRLIGRMRTMAAQRPLTIRLDPLDNIIVARVDLLSGTYLPEAGVTCRQTVALGHKVAAAPIRAGEIVHKYGQIIGVACELLKIRFEKPLHSSVPKIVATSVVWCRDLEDKIETAFRFAIGFCLM